MIRKLIICIAVLVDFCPMAWGTVDDVPNPKTYDADNWVSDPDHILDSETKNKINDILQQLEDSLTIEVAVVALNSIGEEEPHEFAVTLFNRWGVGKAEDDNGLLILLTRDIRDITFKTGYGLEGVLPDAICKRIQMETMVPHLRENDWNTGMLEGVKAVAAVLYGSDYQAAPPEAWIKKVPAYHPFPGLYRVCPDADTYKLVCLEIGGTQDDAQRRRDGSRIDLAGDPKTLYCTHPARTVLAGTGVARHAGYCLLVFRHTETKDPQAQPDMPEMQPGNPPGDSFARVDKRYETAD